MTLQQRKTSPEVRFGQNSLKSAWQGRQDSNLQPTVLETATLPIELRPYTCTNNCNKSCLVLPSQVILLFLV